MKASIVAACLALLPAAAAPQDLVYAYTYQSGQTDDADKAYGLDKMDPGGGGTFMFHNVNQHYRSPTFAASQDRRGTIAIEIVRQESDGGLVLRVTEPAPANPSGSSASGVTCVAFGDTTVVCDPNGSISPEAAALLPLLGRDFIDASRLDAARHWHVASSGSYGAVADFTIERSGGPELTIGESAVRTQPRKVEIAASIVYDSARSLPVSVDESTTERQPHGGVVSETIVSHTTLTLKSPGP